MSLTSALTSTAASPFSTPSLKSSKWSNFIVYSSPFMPSLRPVRSLRSGGRLDELWPSRSDTTTRQDTADTVTSGQTMTVKDDRGFRSIRRVRPAGPVHQSVHLDLGTAHKR